MKNRVKNRDDSWWDNEVGFMFLVALALCAAGTAWGYNGLYLIIYGGWCFVGGSVMRWHEQIEDEWREEQQRKWQDEQQRKGRKP